MNIDESRPNLRDYAQLDIFELMTSLKISVVSKSKDGANPLKLYACRHILFKNYWHTNLNLATAIVLVLWSHLSTNLERLPDHKIVLLEVPIQISSRH